MCMYVYIHVTYNNYMGLAHRIMEAEKSQDLSSASGDPEKSVM